MSTLNVTTIQHESASGSTIVLDSDGNVEVAAGITAADGDIELQETGQVLIDCAPAAAFRIRNKEAPNAGNQVLLTRDGNATFAGDITCGTGVENAIINSNGFIEIATSNTNVTITKGGKITAAGGLDAPRGVDAGSAVSVNPAGLIQVRRDGGRNDVFVAYQGGTATANRNVRIFNNGDADFTGTINGDIARSNSIEIRLDPENPDSWKVTQEEYQ